MRAQPTSCDERPPPYRATCLEKNVSPDLPQRLERKFAEYNASNSIYKRWLFEIVSIATSAICMGAIIAILAVIKDQPLQKWSIGLAIITVLSKVASAALILPISEAIGQLKWKWFHGKKSKDVFDFEIFDKASRGAWGSLLLLLRTKGRSLAALGALLTVLLLAIDTFFQQVTDLPERWSLHGNGTIARVTRYEPNVAWQFQDDNLPVVVPNQEIKRALFPFYYHQLNNTTNSQRNNGQSDIPASCPTSKCEWDPYQTLGVCSSCVDVAPLLTYSCLPMKMDWILASTGPTTEHTYPNGTACGYFLNATSDAPVLMSGYRTDSLHNSTLGEALVMRTLPLVTNPLRNPLYGGSINFKHINRPILDALIVSSKDGSTASVYRNEPPIAQECVLSFCVKTLRSAHLWGRYEEEVLDTFVNTSSFTHPWNVSWMANEDLFMTDYFGNVTIFPPGHEQEGLGYGVSNDTITMLILTGFDEIFPSVITAEHLNAEQRQKIRTSYTDRIIYLPVHSSPWLAPYNVTRHLEAMATSITNVMRANVESQEFVTGRALALETFVAVHWAWLTFPLAMLTLSIIFLVATIIRTSTDPENNIGNWKTSAMPTLLYSLPQATRQNLVPLSVQSKNHDRPHKIKIRLMPNSGWRVSGHRQISPVFMRPNQQIAPPGWL